MEKRNIAIIPARSGSKGLKDKNIMSLMGKPLMAYTIEAAIKSRVFDTVMVSTDSQYYADIAIKYGAGVPQLRPCNLSGDDVSTNDVVIYTLQTYAETNKNFDNVCILQPTSPLRNAEEIIAAYSLFCERGAKAVVSVCECEHSPLWTGTLDNTLKMTDFAEKEAEELPRQKLKKYYRQNGGIYWANCDFILKEKKFVTSETLAYIMDGKTSIDIDCLEDFEYAEFLLRKYGVVK